MNPLAQFGSITGSERYECKAQPGVFDELPITGDIDPDLLQVSSLARDIALQYSPFINVPARCCPRSCSTAKQKGG